MEGADIMSGTAYKISKIEIKKMLREELKCDYGFIIHLTKWGMIQKLQDAYADPYESNEMVKEDMDEVYDTYFDYCKVWDLDPDADNRKNREYLGRDISKRVVIPPVSSLSEEEKKKLRDKARKAHS